MKSKDKIIVLKCVEELSELITRLLQHCNKKKDYTIEISEEVRDVEIQIEKIKEFLINDKF